MKSGMGLHFGFLLEMVLIIQCFCFCCAVLTWGQGLFSLSYAPASSFPTPGVQPGVGNVHSYNRWPQWMKGIFHTVRHHPQHKHLGILVWRPLLRDRLLISWLGGSKLHNLSFFTFIPLVFKFSFLLHCLTIIVVILIVIIINFFLLLNTSYLHHNFSHFYTSVFV